MCVCFDELSIEPLKPCVVEPVETPWLRASNSNRYRVTSLRKPRT